MNLLSETKLNLHLDTIDGFKMVDYDFECEVYVFENRRVVKKKADMVKVDDENYLIVLEDEDMEKIGRGRKNALVKAYIPDSDFSDGFRTERVLLCETMTGK